MDMDPAFLTTYCVAIPRTRRTIHDTILESFGSVAIDYIHDAVMSDMRGMPAIAFGEIINLVIPKHLEVR